MHMTLITAQAMCEQNKHQMHTPGNRWQCHLRQQLEDQWCCCLLPPHSNPSRGTSQLPQSCTLAGICAGGCLASWVESCMCPWLAVWLACHKNWVTVMWPLTCCHSCLIATPARTTTNGKLPVPLMHRNVSGGRKEGETSAYLASCVIIR